MNISIFKILFISGAFILLTILTGCSETDLKNSKLESVNAEKDDVVIEESLDKDLEESKDSKIKNSFEEVTFKIGDEMLRQNNIKGIEGSYGRFFLTGMTNDSFTITRIGTNYNTLEFTYALSMRGKIKLFRTETYIELAGYSIRDSEVTLRFY